MNKEIQAILKKLGDLEFIRELSDLVYREVEGSISICFPTLENQKDKIHFMVEPKKETDLFQFANLSGKIQEKLNYNIDYDEDEEAIFILNKKLFAENKINEFFNDITELSVNNFANIQFFLSKNYPNLFKIEVNTHNQQLKSLAFLSRLKADKGIWNILLQESEQELEKLLEVLKQEVENCKQQQNHFEGNLSNNTYNF